MKTVIIPTDFSKAAIQVAEAILRDSREETRIIFIHLFHVADDIQDLLFSNYRKKEYDFVSEEFRNESKMLKNLYPEIAKETKVEFFYGSRMASFKHFLDYNKADYIAYSESYGVPKINKSSIEALPIIKKCGIPLLNTDELLESAFTDARN